MTPKQSRWCHQLHLREMLPSSQMNAILLKTQPSHCLKKMSKRKTDETSLEDLEEVDAVDLRDEHKEGETPPVVKIMVPKRKEKSESEKKEKKHGEQRDVIPLLEWKVEAISERVKNSFCEEIDSMLHTDGPEFWAWTEELDEVVEKSFQKLKSNSGINVLSKHSNLGCPFCDFKDVDFDRYVLSRSNLLTFCYFLSYT